MLRKISLTAMTFTYFFAGLSHFTRFDYFRSLVPAFMPHPWVVVNLAGAVLLVISFLLPFKSTTKLGCYLALLMIGISLPIDAFVLVERGAGIPLPSWTLAARIPFHWALLIWAWFHLKVPKPIREKIRFRDVDSGPGNAGPAGSLYP
ncbi:MAG TPA: hypothetical protein VHE12_04410 [bacterium]|nr:hypothetical protein [bacterium]